ncbi:MAG: MurR/RpiR family transcriptional regulator [Oscillospiraceae bacterium]|jgi:DNA-binding MurR/RpiR family transcriptional regulator|nr:MurR/RpiR family transcriptional regulator [Oscillospiraceae bacterium]
MSRPPFLSRIEQNYPRLSKGHKKIADYILREYDKAAFMTAAVLGAAVGVSESTVVRFAAENGYDGYPDLQRYLQDMIRSRLTSIQRMHVSDTRLSDDKILENAMGADAEMIRRTLEQTSREAFRSAVEAINGAEHIYIQGTRSSAALANFLSLYLNILHPGVVCVDAFSASQIYEQLLRINEKDVCIAISFPRYSKRTITALRFARDRGACAIAITDSYRSPIAELAQQVLVASCDAVAFVDSLVAPLSLINALLAACARSQGDQVYDTLHSLEQIWTKYEIYDSSELAESEDLP